MKTSPFIGWAFILPAAVLLAVYLLYPTVLTIRMSLDTGQGFRLSEFIGLRNFVNLFTKDRFFFDVSRWPPRGALFNTALWVALFTLGTVGIGLLVAVLANTVRYEVLIKTIIFMPMAISFTAAGIIWRFVYSPDPKIGVLNALLMAFVPGADPVPWLGRTSLVNYAVIFAGVWIWTGFAMVVLSAAIKGLPKDVLEAASIDGASGWDTFWRVMMPMIWPTVVVVGTTMIINVLKAFDLVYVMTQGGPRGASRIIGYTMYVETFTNGRAGYGSAVAVIMLILIIPFLIMNLRRFRAEGRSL
ncbi:MAG: sugar ABC transporter permease [Deinococcus sp.]|nr:sugar ABC transporter permease [Deinococcus sp.]